MAKEPKIEKIKISLDNREVEPPKRDEKAGKLRMIFVSGLIAILMVVIILITLPMTVLSWSGLFVYSSIVSLVIFLFVLLFRYFSTLVMAYLYITKYTVEEKEGYYPFVSIIVPVYNEAKVVADSISSLLEIDYPNFEIIIVNDGSTDETAIVAEALVGYQKGRSSMVKVSLLNKPNGGKAKALNAGIQYSEAEFVVCMDGDSQLSSNSLKMGVRHFIDPFVGAVAGNVKVYNRRHMMTDLQALEYLEGLNLARSAQGFLRMVNIIPGPMGFFRKSCLRDAGFYSSDTFAEDADVTLKILAKGWKINYEPNAISYTEAPTTLFQLLKQRYRWTRGILQAIRKHRKFIFNPTLNFNNTLILWSMFYEALIWPAMNIFANVFFIVVALIYGMSSLLFFWWVGIMILDMMAAIYCIAAEREEFRLVLYAIFYRLVFILIIDITKAAATIEEILGFKMTWGKTGKNRYGRWWRKKNVRKFRGYKMELIPILSLIILVATVSTFILAVAAYILYKIRETKGKVSEAPQPTAIPAELVTPTPLVVEQKTTQPGARRTYTGEQYVTRDVTGEFQRMTGMDREPAKAGPELRPTYVGDQPSSKTFAERYTGAGFSEEEKYQPKRKFMRYTQDGYTEPTKEKQPKKKKDEDNLRWR